MKDHRIKRNIQVITQLQGMSESELEVFMEGFLGGLDHWNFNMDNLATFMQLLLQMDSKLAERFMMEMAEKDDKRDGK